MSIFFRCWWKTR